MARKAKGAGSARRSGRRGAPASAGGGHGVGPGGRAVAVEAEIRRSTLAHLRRIEGQVRGVAAMIEADRYCADVIAQISAIRESLHAVARSLMRNHLKHCAPKGLGGPGREKMVEELLRLSSMLSR